MDDMDDTQGETLSHEGDVNTVHQRAVRGVLRTGALYTSVCFVVFVPLIAMCSSMFMLCVKVYAVP